MDSGPAGAVQSQEQDPFLAAVQLPGATRKLRPAQHPGLAELWAAEGSARACPALPPQPGSLSAARGLLNPCAALAQAPFRQGIFCVLSCCLHFLHSVVLRNILIKAVLVFSQS